MRIPRVHTKASTDALEGVRFRAAEGLPGRGPWTGHVVPQGWDDAAIEVLVEKVFHPQALPALTRAVPEEGVPEWLWRREIDTRGMDGLSAENRWTFEQDIRDVLRRVAGGMTYDAWKANIFGGEEDARAFYDELRYILLHRLAAFETAIWRTAGLNWAYGIEEPVLAPGQEAATAPGDRSHALKHIEALDRKAALEDRTIAVMLPAENAESGAFIGRKRGTDIDALARDIGLRMLEQALHHVMDACDRDSVLGFDPLHNFALDRAVREAKRAGLTDAAVATAISYARQGFEEIPLPRAAEEKESAVTAILSLPDSFIESALTGHGFMLYEDGREKGRASAEKLWDRLAEAVWAAGEPHVFFRDSARAASPLEDLAPSRTGGLVFPPGFAAPSAVIDISKLDAGTIAHVAALMTIALETRASGPFRPVLLGVTNISAFLMKQGLAYDSDEGRATAAMAVALVSGSAQRASAALAAASGAFEGYAAIEKEFLGGVKDRMHVFSSSGWMRKGLMRRPAQARADLVADRNLSAAAQDAIARAYVEGREKGYRHAHLTGIDTPFDVQALLGAETRDIAPMGGLVRLGGAVYGRTLSPVAQKALEALGYGAAEIDDIHFHVLGHGTLLDAPLVNHRTLKAKGFHQGALDALEVALKSARHIRYAFNRWTLSEEFCRHMLGFSAEALDDPAFDMLEALGFPEEAVEAANLYCCGAMTLEGAPHLKPRHLAVFDCAAKQGTGVRHVSYEAQVKMQAAVEPFLSGAAAHTIILERNAEIADVQKLFLKGWELGVKRLALWREASSLTQPLGFGAAEVTGAAEEAAGAAEAEGAGFASSLRSAS